MNRATQKIVLLLVGAALIVITVSGTYIRYVKPGMLPWLIAAAVVITTLAVSSLYRDFRGLSQPIDTDHGNDDDGHNHHSRIVWLLTIPIVVLGFVVPPALNGRTAPPTVTAVSNDAPRRPFPPLPAARAPKLPLLEVLLRIATDSSNTLNDRKITITGFTVTDGNNTDLATVVMSCCAADAQLARIRLVGPAGASAANHPDNTWMSVEGTVPSGQHVTNTEPVPDFQVTNVALIDPPKNPYSN